MNKKLLTAIAFTASFFLLKSQTIFDVLEDASLNYYDVQKFADDYFKKNGTGKGSGYKQYKRWEAEMQYWIDEKGTRIDPFHYSNEIKKFKQANPNREGIEANVWTDLGPFSWKRTSSWAPGLGRIDAVAVFPGDHNYIYAGSPEGGVWKTTNGGTSWTSLTDGLVYMKIGAVAVDPSDKNTIYIGTLGSGMLKSTDGGVTLTQINSGLTSSNSFKKIIVSPTDPNNILVAASGGIYRSTNGGSTWTKSLSGSYYDIAFKPGDPNTVYMCGQTFWRSTDNGATFTQVTSGFIKSDVMRLAVTPANPSLVYVVQCNGSVFGAFYKSTNSGQSFTSTVTSPNFFGYSPTGNDNSGQGGYNIDIAASPTDANEVHIAGIITWKTSDGGNNFVCTTEWTYPNSRGYTHCDVHALEYLGNDFYVGSDGGLSVSTDKGDNFTFLSDGMGIRMFYRLGCAKTNATTIAVGAQDNGGSILTTTGWIDWIGADGMEAIVDHTNANIIYGSSQNGTMYKSTNGGNSYSSISEPESNGLWTTPMVMDPNNASTIYVGYSQLHKSTNGASSWTQISNLTLSSLISHIEVAPSNSNYIYISAGGQLYRTTNGGTNWTNISSGLSNATINRISVHNSDPNKVAVAVSGSKIYTSTNGGTNWTNYTANLPAVTTRCLTYHFDSKEGIYVGTNTGVYYRDNTMSSWIQFGTGLPYVPVNEIEIHYASQKVRVATYGRGVWETDLYGLSTGNQNYEPSTDILSVYPNPAKTNLYIQTAQLQGEVNVIIENVSGQKVFEKNYHSTSNNEITIDVSNFAKGIYTVKAIATEKTFINKFVVE